MKKLLLLIIMLPIFAFGQKSETTVFKGAKKILIKTQSNADDNFKLAIEKLIDEGYYIENKDSEYHTLKTQNRKIPNTTYTMFLNLRTKGSDIIIEGQFKPNVEITIAGTSQKEDFEEIVYKGWAINKLAFKSMEKVANLFSMPLIYAD